MSSLFSPRIKNTRYSETNYKKGRNIMLKALYKVLYYIGHFVVGYVVGYILTAVIWAVIGLLVFLLTKAIKLIKELIY